MPGKAKVLGSKEIQTILKVLKTERDRALFATGLYTGLRISEIIAIGQNDVYTTSGGVRNVLKVTRLKKKNTVYSNLAIETKAIPDTRTALIIKAAITEAVITKTNSRTP